MDYRRGPRLAPLAKVEGDELHVPPNGTLPHMCLRCGTTKELLTGPQVFTWKPGGALVEGSILGSALTRSQTIHASICRACKQAGLDSSAVARGSIVGTLIALVVAATVGFNGSPLIGVAIFGAGLAAAIVVSRRFARRALRVAWIHSDGTVALRGVHALVAKAAVEHTEDPR